MIRSIAIAASGMLAAQAQSEIVADNLANSRTPGYKEETGLLTPFAEVVLSRVEGEERFTDHQLGKTGNGVSVAGVVRNMGLGIMEKTGRPGDIALVTAGLFVVQSPDGARYTRAGHFQLDQIGRLVTPDGYPLLGLQGEIKGLSPDFKVNPDGTVSDHNQLIDRLQIVEIESEALIREGQTLFSSLQTPIPATDIQTQQGMLEGSNVDLTGQTEKMLMVMRAYQANQKVIQTQDAILEKAVNEIGKV